MEKRIEIIYDLIIKGLNIDDNLLKIYNFSDDEINIYIEEGLLKKSNNNCYIVGSVDDLYRYGIKLYLLGKIRKAKDCISVCYKLEPNNREVCLQLMNVSLKEKNYIGVARLFNIINKNDYDIHKEDNKLYGFLLGILMDQREDFVKYLRETEVEDIIIPFDRDYDNKNEQNIIRRYIYDQKYKVALKNINDLIASKKLYTTDLELLKELVSQAILKDNRFKSNIGVAIKNKNYNDVLYLLSLKSKNQYLTNKDMYIKIVCETILNIKNTKEIPNVTIYNTDSLYDAIVGNNFSLALIINEEFLKKNKHNVDTDLLHILLVDLITLIDKVELEKEINSVDKEECCFEELFDMSYEEEIAYYIKEENITIDDAKKKYGILPE